MAKTFLRHHVLDQCCLPARGLPSDVEDPWNIRGHRRHARGRARRGEDQDQEDAEAPAAHRRSMAAGGRPYSADFDTEDPTRRTSRGRGSREEERGEDLRRGLEERRGEERRGGEGRGGERRGGERSGQHRQGRRQNELSELNTSEGICSRSDPDGGYPGILVKTGFAYPKSQLQPRARSRISYVPRQEVALYASDRTAAEFEGRPIEDIEHAQEVRERCEGECSCLVASRLTSCDVSGGWTETCGRKPLRFTLPWRCLRLRSMRRPRTFARATRGSAACLVPLLIELEDALAGTQWVSEVESDERS
eukprot:760327-Hanusia_phi.AAC.9